MFNILTDIDGVITDRDAFQKRYGIPFFQTLYIIDNLMKHRVKIKRSDIKESDIIADPDGYSIKDVFKCTKFQSNLFTMTHMLQYAVFEQPRENFSKVIKQLQLDGNLVGAATARYYTLDKSPLGALSRFTFEKWCQKNELQFDYFRYVSDKNSAEEKRAFCEEMHPDIVVEDSMKNIRAIEDLPYVKKIYCFPQPWNKDCRGEKIEVVSTPEEFYSRVRKLEKEGTTKYMKGVNYNGF